MILEPPRIGDARGFFTETWNAKKMAEAGLDIAFVQDNQSLSHQVGTVRGLHYQSPPFAQGKLVRCGQGCLFDVAVDVRKGSPTFGQWMGVELSAQNGLQLWIPEGFLHGFVTREPNTEIIYKCTNYYDKASDAGLAWDDPDIGVDWGLSSLKPVLSDKDKNATSFSDFITPFTFGD